MLSKRIKKDIVLNKIFETSFKKGDYVRYPYGKLIWKVSYVSANGKSISLSSLTSYRSRWYSNPKECTFYKVSKEEAMRFFCLHHPDKLAYSFTTEDLKPFFKKYLREV